MKQQTKDFSVAMLMAFLVILLFIGVVLLLTYLPSISQKMSYGQSAMGFCRQQEGTYIDNLFSEDTCIVDGVKNIIYYDNNKETWRLAK